MQVGVVMQKFRTHSCQPLPPFLKSYLHPCCLYDEMQYKPIMFHSYISQAQTRSADEPMTTFVYCNECGNRWKVSVSCDAFTWYLFGLLSNSSGGKSNKGNI